MAIGFALNHVGVEKLWWAWAAGWIADRLPTLDRTDLTRAAMTPLNAFDGGESCWLGLSDVTSNRAASPAWSAFCVVTACRNPANKENRR
jgi:hypothetical protein